MNVNIQPILDKFNALDLKVRYTVFGILLLLVVGVDYLFLVRAQMAGMSALAKETQKISAETKRVKIDTQRVNQIKEGLESSRTQLQQLNDKVRSLQEVPAILEDISRTANQFGVGIDQLTPMKEAQETLITGGDAKYYALPIVIGARSGYHMFGRFLNQLENGKLLFMLRDIRIEDSGKGTALSIQATIKVILVDRTPGAK